MRQVILPETGTFEAWRNEARGLLAARVPPEDVLWARGELVTDDLFVKSVPPVGTAGVTVPKAFMGVAEQVVWHRHPERFARLYSVLWKLRDRSGLMADRGSPEVAQLMAMAKEVRRDKHKMTAFVRFRETSDPGSPRRRFAAWFEPSNFITEPIAPFFVRRFGDMDWTIYTPDLTASYDGTIVAFSEGCAKPPLPHDATEELWRTYFRNIFNPARLKIKAMQAEMPKKYWKNMPETDLIPGLIAEAEARAKEMAAKAPTIAPARAEKITERLASERARPAPMGDRAELLSALEGCRRCPLWRDATQPVPGEGPSDARLMIVGEQPGDQEDLTGRPFVGPAGQLFDRVAKSAGLDRGQAYVTNAVKHFKFTPRGKRRIHQNPNSGEIQHCKWWLDQERSLVKPELIVAMGGTALESLTGSRKNILKRRGGIEHADDGTRILVTVHPSYILRLPPEHREAEELRFRADLERAVELLERRDAA